MKRFQIWIDEDKYIEIQRMAKQKQMAVSEYVRDILSKRADIKIDIDFADIDSFVSQIEELNRKIDSILPTIYRSGKIYEQEAVLIKKLLSQINDKSNDIWRYITTLRSEMYNEVRGKLYGTIKQNSYKARQNKQTLARLEEKYDSSGNDDVK